MSRIVMGLMFFPRGGSAYAARYQSGALLDAGHEVSLACGTLGPPGAATDARSFFAGIAVHPIDYTDAARTYDGGDSAIRAPVPMHPSYEDREHAPDVVLASVDPALAEHLTAVWQQPFTDADTGRADVAHLHHLTPQLDAVRRHWPRTPLLVQLHGTEIKLVEAILERAAIAATLGTTLAGMPAVLANDRAAVAALEGDAADVVRTTRWEHWRHGARWATHLRAQARAADHVAVVSPKDRTTAIELFDLEPQDVTVIPNGVDVVHFAPRALTPVERRACFRRWLVEEPQGWDESGIPGSVAYRDADLDRVVGRDGDATVLLTVVRFTAAKRLSLLVRAFARARPRFTRTTSLVVWGGSPGEWEEEHPVTAARHVGDDGIFFVGWRGHEELPVGLAASDALVMASVDDSFPQAPLEAMAAGLPVLATRSGGFPSMITADGVRPTGWLVEPDDVDAMADGIVALVNGPAEIARRGANALDHVRGTYSWAGLVPRFEEAYARAVEGAER